MIHVVKHSLGVGKKDQKGAKENMMAHADLWGPLASILNDPAITTTLTDLIVGPRGTIWVDCAHDPGLHRLPPHATMRRRLPIVSSTAYP